MNHDILKKIAAVAAENGLDAMVATSPENFAYLAGFVVPSHHILRWRHSMMVVKPDESVAAFTVDMEESTVRSKAADGTDIRVWGEFTDNAMAVLADLLSDLGLSRSQAAAETRKPFWRE